MKLVYSLIVIVFIALPTSLIGQTECAQSYSKAERAYEEGRLNEVEGILKNCLKNFTSEEKVKAYRIITLAHIFSDRLDEADDSYARLLNADPDYEPSKSDPIEYQHLHNSFRNWPTASVGISGGPNVTIPTITQRYSLENSEDNTPGFYTDQASFQVGIVGEYYLGKRLSISPQILISSTKLKYEERLFDFSTLNYAETQNWIETPIMLKYYLHWKKLNVYPIISLGASASFLQKSTASVVRSVDDGKDATGPDVTITSLRNKQNYSGIVSLGLEKHFRHIHAFINLSYKRDIFTQVDKDKRYNIPELVYRYGYVDNDYTTAYLVASVGISYVFYNHKRITPRIPDLERKSNSFVKKKRK